MLLISPYSRGKWLVSPLSSMRFRLTIFSCSPALLLPATQIQHRFCYQILYRCKALAKTAIQHPVFPTTLPNSSTFLRGFIRKDVPLEHYSQGNWQLFKHQLKLIYFPLLPTYAEFRLSHQAGLISSFTCQRIYTDYYGIYMPLKTYILVLKYH